MARACEGLDFRDAYREALIIETSAREALRDDALNDLTRRQMLSEWSRATAALDKARIGMAAAFSDTITNTLTLYNIAPKNGNGRINDGPVEGGRAVWTPRYEFRTGTDQEILREMTLPKGPGKPARKTYLAWKQSEIDEEKTFAMTWADGRVDVLDESFEAVVQKNSPRVLGYLLHHESVHFDQLRAGTWKTLNEREIDAYRESIAAAPRFGLTPDEIKGLNKMLSYNRKKVWLQGLGWADKPRELATPEIESKYKSAWEELEKAIRVDVPAERERLQQQLEIQRSGRNAPNQEPSPEHSPSDTTNSGSIGAPWGKYHALKDTARSLCETIDFLQQWFGTIDDWKAELKAVPETLHVRDLDAISQTFSCGEYVMFQGIYAFRKGYDVSDLEFIKRLVREGKVRETDSRPYRTRVTPAPSQPAPTLPLAAPTAPPEAVYPEPRPSMPDPEPPSIPHCHYHPWCKG